MGQGMTLGLDGEKTVAVAMSGGVDSTVTAAILQDQGYKVEGFYMDLGLPGAGESRVFDIARRLAIKLHIIDLADFFQEQVVDYFCQNYLTGRTPNPCVVCNPLVKFGRLLAAARDHGIEKLATGHYVKIKMKAGLYSLTRGADPAKDQSYFLCGLSQEQLSRLLFPLGAMLKTEVYLRARQLGFDDFAGKESQDVCFLPGGGVADFLQHNCQGGASVPPGDIVSLDGTVLARHQGIFRYTVGQRRGLAIPDKTPYYVVALDAGANRVIVGKEPDLWQRRLHLIKPNWLAGREPELPAGLLVQIRYRHQPAQAEVCWQEGGLVVDFDEPQRAVTPGQFAVFYEGNTLIGGAEIEQGPGPPGKGLNRQGKQGLVKR